MNARFKLGGSLLGLLLVIGLALPIGASSHIEQNGKWFVGGFTTDEEGDGRIDPLTVVFKGNDDGSQLKVNAKEMLDKWVNGSRGDLRNQGEPGCLTSQGIYYQHPRVFDDQEEFNQKSGCFEDAWHVRLWDSKEHDDDHHPDGSAQRDTWAIMGVHYDKCCDDVSITDRPGLSWEKAAVGMKEELAEYCSYTKWKHLPASGPVKFQGRFSDGILTRISPETVNGGGPCG